MATLHTAMTNVIVMGSQFTTCGSDLVSRLTSVAPVIAGAHPENFRFIPDSLDDPHK